MNIWTKTKMIMQSVLVVKSAWNKTKSYYSINIPKALDQTTRITLTSTKILKEMHHLIMISRSKKWKLKKNLSKTTKRRVWSHINLTKLNKLKEHILETTQEINKTKEVIIIKNRKWIHLFHLQRTIWALLIGKEE